MKPPTPYRLSWRTAEKDACDVGSTADRCQPDRADSVVDPLIRLRCKWRTRDLDHPQSGKIVIVARMYVGAHTGMHVGCTNPQHRHLVVCGDLPDLADVGVSGVAVE